MRLPWHAATCFVGLLLGNPCRAETPNPLRLIPDQADVLVKLEQPRSLVEAVLNHPLVKDLYRIDAIHDLYSSTNARRFYQLIGYFEKELGAPRLELLDRLAGGGAALAIKFDPNPAPVLLIVQAKDEQLLRRFFQLGLELLEQELARQEAKDRPEKSSYRGVEIVALGKDFHAAVVGSALAISNVEKGVQLAIDQQLDGGKKSLAQVASVADARRLLWRGLETAPQQVLQTAPQRGDPLVWMWLNLETARKTPGGKQLFKENKSEQPALTVLAGPLLDIARRSPFVCAGLYRQAHGFTISFRVPRGRNGMPPELAILLPPVEGPASRPLLKPQGVLYSASDYLDVAKLWENRAKLLGEKPLKKLEEFDKNSGRFLGGTRLSQLLTEAGPYQRVVVAHQPDRAYQTTPGQYIPAFAFILEMRRPESFSKRAETVLRGAALVATTQVPLQLVEEKHGARQIVGYRFPEDRNLKGDTNNLRFNFSPCFVAVGNQFVISSNFQLCRELVDLLEQEAANAQAKGSYPSPRTQIYASGAIALLEAFKDRLFTQTILDQAIPPDRAKEQVEAFTDWVRRLGILQIAVNYGSEEFRYDVQLRLADQ
jgi:hypothetical protein